ncbi:hypothetical protein M885DRAFT_511436 [Pelagophyceae sp. CCMP2097]|nr:hypothetical protein M885DRAFT_511436 [Pelagophyceae sp. CCMP2097]
MCDVGCRAGGFPVPPDEGERLALLKSLGLLDLPRTEEFERITALCAASLEVPMCLVSLLDTKRQFFLSNRGLGEVRQTPRDVAFCNHAIMPFPGKVDSAGRGEPADIFVVDDALRDARFNSNAVVVGGPNIRFYAGVPLRVAGDDGVRRSIGTLCAVDTALDCGGLGTYAPKLDAHRRFGAREKQILLDFAAITVGAIEQRRSAARALAVAKSDFISCTAHDIRTPVTCFAMALEALRETPLDSDQHALLRDAALSVDVLSETVDRAISAGRKTHGHPEAQRERVDVRALSRRVDALVRALHSGASKRDGGQNARPRSKLVFDVAADVPRFILTDGALLWRCVLNYVTNALKATASDPNATIFVRFSRDASHESVECLSDDDSDEEYGGGQSTPPPSPKRMRPAPRPPPAPRVLARGLVALGAQSQPESWLKLEVLDRGGGVPAETVPILFNAFVQAPEAREGSGLGLAAVKQCAQMLGGACGMRERRQPTSGRPGGGCVFWLLAPLVPASNAETDESNAVSPTLEPRLPVGILAAVKAQAQKAASAETAVVQPSPQQQPPRAALVIEDSLPIRKMLSRLLQRRGFVVDEAGDGEAGLCKLQSRSYDLTIVDFLMPILDGVSCTRRFREWESQQKPPGGGRRRLIVGSSANADAADVSEAMAAGLDLYIPKPIGSKHVADLIENFPYLQTGARTLAHD